MILRFDTQLTVIDVPPNLEKKGRDEIRYIYFRQDMKVQTESRGSA